MVLMLGGIIGLEGGGVCLFCGPKKGSGLLREKLVASASDILPVLICASSLISSF